MDCGIFLGRVSKSYFSRFVFLSSDYEISERRLRGVAIIASGFCDWVELRGPPKGYFAKVPRNRGMPLGRTDCFVNPRYSAGGKEETAHYLSGGYDLRYMGGIFRRKSSLGGGAQKWNRGFFVKISSFQITYSMKTRIRDHAEHASAQPHIDRNSHTHGANHTTH